MTIALAAAILAPAGAASASATTTGDASALPSAVRADLAASGDLATFGGLTSGDGVTIDVLTKSTDGSLAVQTVSAGSEGQARAAVDLLNAQGTVVAADLSVSASVAGITPAGETDEDYTPYQWGNAAIHSDKVEDKLAGSYGDVTVAVLDTGVANHADLANVLPVVNANTDPVSPGTRTDVNGHGTHVAGTISASINGFGVDGIAPGVRILPVKVFPDSGSGTSAAIARGITAAIDADVSVINMSLTMSGQNSAVQAAIDAARAQGIVVVAATGNAGAPCGGFYTACGMTSVSYPAAGAGVIAVGATAEDGTKAVFSQTGVVDVSAPGDSIFSTYNSHNYVGMSGTSMSTPHVAGVAALIKTANPDLTPDQVEDVLKTTSQDLGTPGYDTSFGAGQVDAYASVVEAFDRAGVEWPNVVQAPVADVTGVSVGTGLDGDGKKTVTVSWDSIGSDDAGTEFVVEFDGDDQTQMTANGSHAHSVLASTLTPGAHTVRVARYVEPRMGAFSAATNFNVAAPVLNGAPVATDDAGLAFSGAMSSFDVLSNDTDPDDDTLTLVDLGPTQHGSAGIMNGKVNYTPAAGYTGTEVITYRITDGTQFATGKLTVDVMAPIVIPPVVIPPVVTPPVTTPPVVTPPVVTPPVTTPPVVVTPPVVTPPVVTPPVVTPPVVSTPGNPVANRDGSTSYTAPNGQSVTVKGAIQEAYKAAGSSAGVLGVPTTSELTAPDGTGKYTHFQNGSIYWTPATGAHLVKGEVKSVWSAKGWEKGLGYPTSDEFAVKGGTVQRFESGLVYSNGKTANEVHGAILTRYAAGGWENGLGLPTTSESVTPDQRGRYNHFEGGSVYWTATTGAHVVKGDVKKVWSAAGWEAGRVGYPTSDAIATRDGGSVQRFERGLAYSSPNTGTHLVFGAFQGVFAAQGWENGALGYPTSDEYMDNAGRTVQDYQGGTLVWDAGKVTRG